MVEHSLDIQHGYNIIQHGPEQSWVHVISLYCNGCGLTQEGSVELVCGHAHKLLSLESPETLLRAQPYISTDVLSPRHTGAHLLKLDII